MNAKKVFEFETGEAYAVVSYSNLRAELRGSPYEIRKMISALVYTAMRDGDLSEVDHLRSLMHIMEYIKAEREGTLDELIKAEEIRERMWLDDYSS